MENTKLGFSHITKKVHTGKENKIGLFEIDMDVTEDFKRCVVLFCTESVEFEVDGMKFRSTCERID